VENERCSCGAPIIWARTTDGEQVALTQDPVMRLVKVEERVSVTIVEEVPTYTRHLDQCPQAYKPRATVRKEIDTCPQE
jgi:hypothetical protein